MIIKEILKERGLTQTDLANLLGVSVQSVRQTLNADSVSTKTLQKIASALNVPLWRLFVNPIDIQKENTFVCPKCGTPLQITIKQSETD